MDSGAFELLESVTLKTLHAHSFARSSSQASVVLTDLLSRYLTLLSSTCAQYAQHAGRANLTARDAICALDELGVNVEELSEYCGQEGEELARYAGHSAQRLEDLKDFKASLLVGLPPARESIPLVYATLPDSLPEEEEEEDLYESSEPEDVHMEEVVKESVETRADVGINAEVSKLAGLPPLQRVEQPISPRTRPSSPPLPLSPISNPSSPARKRARTENWHPPSHIPDFLPPFPSDRTSLEPEPLALPPPVEPPSIIRPQPIKQERPASPSRPAPSAPSDYLTAVPYSLSSLASTPEWQLPSSSQNPSSQILTPSTTRLPLPQVQPSLIAAYHHILTHPPPATPGPTTLARHKVAMQFLQLVQRTPRWEPADTLYASTSPNAPAVAYIGPTHPVPIGPVPSVSDEKEDDKEKKANGLPPLDRLTTTAYGRLVAPTERLTPLVSIQTSRIPELADRALSVSFLTALRHFVQDLTPTSPTQRSVQLRTTRLGHPPVLQRGPEKLTYGTGINAPWNSNSTSTAAPAVPTPIMGKGKESLANGLSNGKGKEPAEKEKKAIPDARLYATWEYEQKSFKEPLTIPRRARQGSIQSNVFNAATLGRAWSEGRMG
ncbi:hypothetical protein EW146_g3495 [Bondarzewia mesenterica]|uniref:Bromodomain associated domain-containing protein n=1 Tax=Bondarzewia mesenterica TaxID=1095465 RepID=A0A4S4LXM5_9AGAM|nr:hypothetical protein EW146_g3495 [Bondarzewia mesenterica]